MEKAQLNLQVIGSETAPTGSENQSKPPPAPQPEPAAGEKKPSGGFPPEVLKGRDHPKVLRREHLINKLNYINFQDGTILVNLKHSKYKRPLMLHAKPLPCQDEHVVCLWLEPGDIGQKLRAYEFESFFVIDGKKMLSVEPLSVEFNENGVSFCLPETCYEVGSRHMIRHPCQGIGVQMIQNGSLFRGQLLDCNAVSFRVELQADGHPSFQWINPDARVSAILSDGTETLFTGECRIVRHGRGQKTRRYVLEPLKTQIQRFQQKEFRSTRQELNPSPDIYFQHPLTKKMVSLKVVDLSGSGFSVEEDEPSAVLMTGMIIPEVELRFAENFSLTCKAQVVYRKALDAGHRGIWIKCGLAILDMKLADNVRLLSLLHQADNRYAYVCNDVDMDELWDFFFESGFIYPEKYAYIEANKRRIKDTYRKLYTGNANIARHFIYQEKGHILGHMAMVRFYENAWLIHHHAARKSALNKAGLIVLKQIGRFINDSYRLNSIHLDYVVFYYRPNNKFPSRVFGGAARFINHSKRCSSDPFAYLHLPLAALPSPSLPAGWELAPAGREDFLDLECFYEHNSGGLMLKALNIEPDSGDEQELQAEFARLGFKREKQLFALKCKGVLKAMLLVNISDIGLNLSNLTNCISGIVLDPEDLSQAIFFHALAALADKMALESLTLLIFPVAFADRIQLPCEKVYNMWIMNIQHIDHYFRYLKRLMRFV
jgi:hypothetical protein